MSGIVVLDKMIGYVTEYGTVYIKTRIGWMPCKM